MSGSSHAPDLRNASVLAKFRAMFSHFFRAFDFLPFVAAGMLFWLSGVIIKDAIWMQKHGVEVTATLIEKDSRFSDGDRKYFLVYQYEAQGPDSLRKRMRVDGENFAQAEVGHETYLIVSPNDPSKVTFDAEADLIKGEGLREFATIISGPALAWLLCRCFLAWRAYRAVKRGERIKARVTKIEKRPFKRLLPREDKDDEKVRVHWAFEGRKGRTISGSSLKRYKRPELFYLNPGSTIHVHTVPGSRTSFWSKEMGTGEG